MLAKPLAALALLAQSLAFSAPTPAADFAKAQAELLAFSQSAEYRRLVRLGGRASAEIKRAIARHPGLTAALSPQGLATLPGRQAVVRPILAEALPLLERSLGQVYPVTTQGIARLGAAYLNPAEGSVFQEAGWLAEEWLAANNP